MTTKRITAASVQHLRTRLSSRDLLIVTTLSRVRLATARQLQVVCFPDLSPVSAARQTRRALRRLVELRVLARLDRMPGGVGGGAPGHVYSLDVAGLRLAAGPDHPGPIRRPWPLSRLFLEHGLAVTDIYCELVTAQRAGLIELEQFTTEPGSWRHFVDLGGRTTLKPDVYVRLRRNDWQYYLFLEVDRGTEGPSALNRQLDLYVRYWHSGTEQAHQPVFPRVVWSAPSPGRMKRIAALIARLPAEAQQLFRLTTRDAGISGLITGDDP